MNGNMYAAILFFSLMSTNAAQLIIVSAIYRSASPSRGETIFQNEFPANHFLFGA